jgi:hypothetical protein
MGFSESLSHTLQARQLFWNNVIREILSSLAAIAAQSEAPPEVAAAGGGDQPYPVIPGVDTRSELPSIFDGRLGLILTSGQRIPIAHLRPVFAIGITDSPAHRWLSAAVEGTVYEITTPEGEVLTIPIHEIRAFHSLNEELLERLRASARTQQQGDAEQEQPFGFAAFTSLARGRTDPETPDAVSAGSPVYDPGWVGE